MADAQLVAVLQSVIDEQWNGPFHPASYAELLGAIAQASKMLAEEETRQEALDIGVPELLVAVFSEVSERSMGEIGSPGCGSATYHPPVTELHTLERMTHAGTIEVLWKLCQDPKATRRELLEAATRIEGGVPGFIAAAALDHPAGGHELAAALALAEVSRQPRIPRAVQALSGALFARDVLAERGGVDEVISSLAGSWEGGASSLAEAAAQLTT